VKFADILQWLLQPKSNVADHRQQRSSRLLKVLPRSDSW